MASELQRREAGSDSGLNQFSNEIPVEVNPIGKFLQQRVLRAARDGEGGAARIVLRHVVNGKIADRIDEGKLDAPGQLTSEKVAALALEVYKAAANHAENCKGEQHYMLQWFSNESPNEDPYIHPLVVKIGKQTNSNADGYGYVDSYPATEQGLTSMLMRRMGQLDEKLLEAVEAMVAPVMVMKEMLKDSIEDNAALRREIRENAKAIDDAKHAAWERAEESASRKADREMKSELMGGVRLLVPAIAKRVGLIDKNAPLEADNAHIVALVASLAQRGGLEGILGSDLLTDEEKGHIVSTVEAHLEKLVPEEKTAAAPKQLNAPRPPADLTATPSAPVVPPTPAQLAAMKAEELAQAQAQAAAWAAKAAELVGPAAVAAPTKLKRKAKTTDAVPAP